MKSLKISHVLDITANTPPALARVMRRDFVYKNVRLFDSHDENIAQHFRDTHDFIEQCLSNGGNILVHCEAGISRSATVVIAYLIKSRRMDMTSAFRYVRQCRSIVQPNFGFIGQLLMFEEQTLWIRTKDFMAEYLLTILPMLGEQGVTKEELQASLEIEPNWAEAVRAVLAIKAAKGPIEECG